MKPTLVSQTYTPNRRADHYEAKCEEVAQKEKTIVALMRRIESLEAEVLDSKRQAAGRLQWRMLT
jgi:hypothetical protein